MWLKNPYKAEQSTRQRAEGYEEDWLFLVGDPPKAPALGCGLLVTEPVRSWRTQRDNWGITAVSHTKYIAVVGRGPGGRDTGSKSVI